MKAIVAAACIFPSGPTLPLAAVAHRLQFSLIRKHPIYVDQRGSPIRACYFPEIVSVSLVERFRQLLWQVLTELINNQPALKHPPPGRVSILLPPLDRPGITPELTAAVKEAVKEITGWYDTPVHVLHGGSAEAVGMMDLATEAASFVLLAVESWLLAPSLQWLDGENLLHNAHRTFQENKIVNPYGRVPSEGAAALVLASPGTGCKPWCHIRGSGQSIEDVLYSDKGVCHGKGLRQAASLALEAANITELHHLVSDINGEPYRADELGFTLFAMHRYNGEGLIRETPVLASGDLGCASLVAHMALTAWRMRSSEHPSNTLLLSTSDDGRRGAVVMSKTQGSQHADN
ncbi:hypothetical protein [Buttiauxella sp. A111]|uniref:hypothetical protein n=1 Tax=Buttiauxella sp. A111 TaxID=2563088 RepID=UPI0010D16419|nr:hypothetical protein [Buttiauxella sp. A111]GDX07312.1 hypothetical protein BSPA111_35270 [Buttiauxella sp. A111]